MAKILVPSSTKVWYAPCAYVNGCYAVLPTAQRIAYTLVLHAKRAAKIQRFGNFSKLTEGNLMLVPGSIEKPEDPGVQPIHLTVITVAGSSENAPGL